MTASSRTTHLSRSALVVNILRQPNISYTNAVAGQKLTAKRNRPRSNNSTPVTFKSTALPGFAFPGIMTPGGILP